MEKEQTNNAFSKELKKEHRHIMYLASFGVASLVITTVLLVSVAFYNQQRFAEVNERLFNIETGLTNLVVIQEDEIIEQFEEYLQDANISTGDNDTSVSTEELRVTDPTVEPLADPKLIIPTR